MMINWKNMSELEVAEALAHWEDMVCTEEELSEKFDDEVGCLMAEEIDPEDVVAFSEEFSNWADALCTNGEISTIQYESYGYVGKYSDE